MGDTRFTSIEVEDIFAYRGLSRIDLSACTDERNVVIVTGQNGAGKTSLLNAIKLLFLGAENESMRRVLFGNTPVGARHFVLGLPGRWYGVFNTTAPQESPARIAMEWTVGSRRFRAERFFERTISVQGYRETLKVTMDGGHVVDAPAVLLQLLPKEVVPFFFFDGEEIQSLADSEGGRERVEIERLLGLSFVAILLRELDLYAKAKYKVGLPTEVSLDIVRNENKEREAQARIESASTARISLEEEIQGHRNQQERLDEERNLLRTGISEADRNRMITRIKILKNEREKLAAEIAEELPIESPWLVNHDLVKRAFESLENYIGVGVTPDLVKRLHDDLPVELLRRLAEQRPPITLDEHQQKRFQLDVEEALSIVGVAARQADNPMFTSLSPRQINALHRRFLIWSERGASLAFAQAERLRSMRQMTHEQLQAEQTLDEAEITTNEARQHFNSLTEKIALLETKVQFNLQAIGQHVAEEEQAKKELNTTREATRRLHVRYEEVTRKNRAYQFAVKVSKALLHYREQKRARIRKSVEDRLNLRIGTLLAPSQLIKSIRLDKQFNMTYWDERGNEVARRSTSAGMRQLVAMSMLWALKDEANKPLPVVIDTPLGRIDRENRALLMSEYFPRAGNPLVLLPTNSEFSTEDDLNLSSRIARRYVIQNIGGDQARIVESGSPQTRGRSA